MYIVNVPMCGLRLPNKVLGVHGKIFILFRWWKRISANVHIANLGDDFFLYRRSCPVVKT